MKYEVINFFSGEVFRTNDLRSAYKFADRSKREFKFKCCVIGKNLFTNEKFFNYCDCDYITGEWIKYLNGQENQFETITNYA